MFVSRFRVSLIPRARIWHMAPLAHAQTSSAKEQRKEES